VPPLANSRYILVTAASDLDTGLTFLFDRERVRFEARRDNVRVVVRAGDTLQSLASRFFAPFPNPEQLWWLIADFQPDPIVDPTIDLEPGTILYLPSLEFIGSSVFSDARRDSEVI
jgi:hypothetical protein